MSDSPAALPRAAPPFREWLLTYAKRLPQRCAERDFWIIQAGVAAVTALHALIELWLVHRNGDISFDFNHIAVVLYLAPIAYASLRYGMEGAVLTGLWSAVLIVPNVLLWHRTNFQWFEVVYVAIVISVGIVMSVPVERERAQRQRAEATVERQVLLGDIATLTLTADLPTTLDQTLRRLLHTLNLQVACVAVQKA